MFRKYFIVRTGVCGALFLGVCATMLAKCDDTNKVVAPKQIKINHDDVQMIRDVDLKSMNDKPYTEWNNKSSPDAVNHFKCGSYSLTVTDVETAVYDESTGKNNHFEYAFLKVVNDGFTLAEATGTDYNEGTFPEQSVDANGEWVSDLQAGGKNADGKTIHFHMFATSKMKDDKIENTSFSFVQETEGSSAAPVVIQCKYTGSNEAGQ